MQRLKVSGNYVTIVTSRRMLVKNNIRRIEFNNSEIVYDHPFVMQIIYVIPPDPIVKRRNDIYIKDPKSIIKWTNEWEYIDVQVENWTYNKDWKD